MLLVIRWTVVAQNVVAHPTVIARALPDSPVTPKLLMFYVFSDPLDGSGSTCGCASDGASSSSS
eukprot:3646225-Heterocapsa_arctica.AAC.1